MTLSQSMQQGLAFDGQPAKIFELHNENGMRVAFMDIGATWLSCQVPIASESLRERPLREVLLGVDSIEKFSAQQVYMGTTVGRFANRIAKGQFSLMGDDIQVESNQFDNCLHGGPEGFDKRRWFMTSHTESSVSFALVSPDGDQGFPGELSVEVCYTLTSDNRVVIDYRAMTDAPTVVNLTNHAYFNLLGADVGQDILDHQLQISATHYVATDDKGIPAGVLVETSGSEFDFEQPHAIAASFMQGEQQTLAKGYDHCFVFDVTRDVSKPVARLSAPDGKLSLEVMTTKPGMQLYTGNWLAGTPSRRESPYRDYAGVALETQYFPDAPNRPEWAQSNATLMPNECYQHQTVYRFL
ncbi:galactose-1-epimerase [Vibrio sp. SM6]|uniref:Aldose 1-epimerase n=1 Tax=Vibrio agarilyticus TaxID=2726741 RepID=A0A7X8YGL6_9VIBR|nr:galactose-1-epimerase [Vibrio agarilyticus]NLS12670.1 galactose-1-epimerase [Vibrio agarilyticus]